LKPTPQNRLAGFEALGKSNTIFRVACTGRICQRWSASSVKAASSCAVLMIKLDQVFMVLPGIIFHDATFDESL
jgi:hypothetical protein